MQLARIPIARLEVVLVLGSARKGLRDGGRATRPRRLQHLHHEGPSARPDRHPDRRLDRCGTRSGHEGRLSLLRCQERRVEDHRVRQDLQGASGQPEEVRLPVTVGRVDRAPRPDDFAATADAGRSSPVGRGGPSRPTRAARPPAGAPGRGRSRRLLRGALRARPLPDRVRPRRWRGPGRRDVGLVPRHGRRARAAGRQPLPDPGRAGGARRADRAGLRQSRGALAGARRRGRASGGSGSRPPSSARPSGRGSRRPRPTSSWSRSRA